MPHDFDPMFNSSRFSFDGSVGSSYTAFSSDDMWYNDEYESPPDWNPNTANEVEPLQLTEANHVGLCAQSRANHGGWNTTLQAVQERHLFPNQIPCDLSVDIPKNNTSEMTRNKHAYPFSAIDYSQRRPSLSQRSSDTDRSVSLVLLKRSASASKVDGYLLGENTTKKIGKKDASGLVHPPNRHAKTSHSLVERKYRENLNSKFDTLRQSLPSMQRFSHGYEGSDMIDPEASIKPRKADILTNATEYVQQLKERNNNLNSELAFQREKILAMEGMTHCENCYLRSDFQVMQLEHTNGVIHEAQRME
jgi:hypothetical protein